MTHFLLSHVLAMGFWVPVAWGLVKLKHRLEGHDGSP
jgi:hypothetical protein